MLWNEAPMIPKYLATLAIAVFLVTFAASSLKFATRSQVLSGKAVDETLHLEFTIDADNRHTYAINPRIKQFLEAGISFYAEGPARVVSARVEVTPKDVSWTESCGPTAISAATSSSARPSAMRSTILTVTPPVNPPAAR